MPKSIVAALQIGSLPGGKADTLEQILSWEAAIRESGANLVVMPEALLGGYPKGERFGTQLGYRLPEAVPPQFDYVAVAIHGDVAYVSGQIPRRDATTVVTGKLGADLDLERGREAAQLCVLHGLAQLKARLGSLEAP